MSEKTKCPTWIPLGTSDTLTDEGRYVLGGMSDEECADYGRWMILQQLLARSTDARIDVSDPRRLRGLARDLGMGPERCEEFLGMLLDGGCIDRDAWEGGRQIFVPSVWNAVTSYQSQCRVNAMNGRKGGRPRKRDAAPEADTSPDAPEPQPEPDATERETDAPGDAVATHDVEHVAGGVVTDISRLRYVGGRIVEKRPGGTRASPPKRRRKAS